MSGDNVTPIDAAARQVREQVPVDMAKMALWRKGLPNPTTFLVKEEDGRAVMRAFEEGVPFLSFKTYYDGTGRQSQTVIQTVEVVGVTLEYATLQLTTA